MNNHCSQQREHSLLHSGSPIGLSVICPKNFTLAFNQDSSHCSTYLAFKNAEITHYGDCSNACLQATGEVRTRQRFGLGMGWSLSISSSHDKRFLEVVAAV